MLKDQELPKPIRQLILEYLKGLLSLHLEIQVLAVLQFLKWGLLRLHQQVLQYMLNFIISQHQQHMGQL
ncbi:hypothetical protein D3C85_1788890 [compost metagenome]